VICSVTTLGARGRSPAAIARDVVEYLEGRRAERAGSRAQQRIELPAPEGGTVAYYADSAGEGPGTWTGAGARRLGLTGEVRGDDLAAVLEGLHPSTRQPLVSAQGSAGRADNDPRPMDDRPLWSMAEAAQVAGVSASYLRRLAAKTEKAAARRVMELLSGRRLSPAPTQWLAAQRVGAGWVIPADELKGFLSRREPPAVVVGYDVTFSVEKSVSAIWARADDTTRAEILAAVDASVAAGTAYLETQAFRVRVKGERHPATGMIAASYLHSTSRAADPQLHRHVVVANVATGPDGMARAVDSTSLYHHAMTAGYLAGAELRHQLTARLGVEWTAVSRGLAEVAGVGEEALAAISTRSQEMAALAREIALAEGSAVGTTSAAARQKLALATRAAKEGGFDPEALRRQWRATLDGAGFDAELAEGVLHRVDGPQALGPADVAELFAFLGSEEGVTANQATFDRRHVLQAVASWSVDRLSATACQELAGRWLACPEVVPLQPTTERSWGRDLIHRHDGTTVAVGAEQLYTTRGILALERRIDTRYRAGRSIGRAVIPAETVERVLADPAFAHLADEQQALVRQIATSGDETGLVCGPAGTGKTTAVEAAARAWELAGHRVVGASVNGSAAERLGRAAGIETRTVASLLYRLEHETVGSRFTILDRRTVVVLDEATTLANRDLDRLLTHVHRHGAALRLIGDPAQHTAVGAGGAFRHLLESYEDDVAGLSVNRRQVGDHLAQVRLALAEYRDHKVREALERLELDQRIVTAPSAGELLDALAADWYVERQRHLADPSIDPSSMTAAHHDERRELTARARALLVADGTVSGPELVTRAGNFCAGDEVIAKRPTKDLRPEGGGYDSRVKNGIRGVVVEVGEDGLVVDFEHRGEIYVPRSYIDQEVAPGVRGGLLHSYCLTTCTAQGDTYGKAHHLGTDRSSQAELYVGLTRGRNDVRLYAVSRDQFIGRIGDELPRLREVVDPAEAMVASAVAGGRERLAGEIDPMAARVVELLERNTVAELLVLRRQSDDKTTAGLAARAYALATDHHGAQAVVEPSERVVRFLGTRPPAAEGLEATDSEPSTQAPDPREAWDAAVAAVAVYQATYEPRSFPGEATDELIGLRAFAADPGAWDGVDVAISDFLAIAPDLVIDPPDLGMAVEL
jgi:conjugative relaxase-like TrwC/TraI family protein